MKLMIGTIAALILALSTPAIASESELLIRIEALEERISVLESLLGISDVQQEETESAEIVESAGTNITLGTGTWIVGEDIPAGKYKIVCQDGTSTIKIYNSYEDRVNKSYSYVEDYMMSNEEYIERTFSMLGEDTVNTYKSLYVFEVNNVYLSDGMCLYIDSGSLDFYA